MREGQDAWYYILEILGKAGEKDCAVVPESATYSEREDRVVHRMWDMEAMKILSAPALSGSDGKKNIYRACFKTWQQVQGRM